MLTRLNSPPPFATPVDPDTGMPFNERQVKHRANLREAAEALTDAMHFAEGSNPPDGPHQEHHWQDRRMDRAAGYLEIALMLANKAVAE